MLGTKIIAPTCEQPLVRWARMDCFFARESAEGVFIVEDVKNIGPNYDPTLLAWEENFRRAWPRFADRYGERFRRMWRFYLLSCAGAFRARSLQVYSILFSKEPTAIESGVGDRR